MCFILQFGWYPFCSFTKGDHGYLIVFGVFSLIIYFGDYIHDMAEKLKRVEVKQHG